MARTGHAHRLRDYGSLGRSARFDRALFSGPRGITRVPRRERRSMMSVSAWPIGATPLRGEPWSTRARDWADLMEPAMGQLYRAILERLELREGTTLLDAGCGSGLFCRLAADRGARVFGLDAAPALLDIARERVTGGTVDVGDLGRL